MFYYLYISMKKNKLIVSQKQAAKILLRGNVAAKAIPDNEPQLYVIEDLLYAYGKSLKTFTVWAVKTGKSSYTGVLIDSGIIDDNERLVGAVRVVFADMNIVRQVESGEFVTPYIQALHDHFGKMTLAKRINVSDSVTAQKILCNHLPILRGKPAVMIRTNRAIFKKCKCNSFWGIKTSGGYWVVNPYSGTMRLIALQNVLNEMAPGERMDKHYRLIQKGGKNPRLLLWRIKKEVS